MSYFSGVRPSNDVEEGYAGVLIVSDDGKLVIQILDRRDDGAHTVALVNRETGEIREQIVDLPDGWQSRTAKRLNREDAANKTPYILCKK